MCNPYLVLPCLAQAAQRELLLTRTRLKEARDEQQVLLDKLTSGSAASSRLGCALRRGDQGIVLLQCQANDHVHARFHKRRRFYEAVSRSWAEDLVGAF